MEFISAEELKEMSMKIIKSPLWSCNEICVESPKSNIGHNVCSGDSGGPFICQVPGKYEWELQGIVSHRHFKKEFFGKESCDPRKLNRTSFTSVYPMKKWIIATMKSFYGKA